MKTKNTILYIYTETAMHAGTGVGLGAVDLPIQREKHTNYPIIQASGVKGALRHAIELQLDDDKVKVIFGGATGEKGQDYAGAVSPGDARILLFPVRALSGVFVWVTAWSVLARFAQETGIVAPIPNNKEEGTYVSSNRILVGDSVMLEEFSYAATVDQDASDWAGYLADNALPPGFDYWKSRLKSHLVILPESEFRDFVRYSTDIVTRIHLDDTTKTVMDGQLFTQELLPADSLFYSSVRMTDSRDFDDDRKTKMPVAKVFENIKGALEKPLQIGADETVGRGRVRLNWQEV